MTFNSITYPQTYKEEVESFSARSRRTSPSSGYCGPDAPELNSLKGSCKEDKLSKHVGHELQLHFD